MAVLGKRSNATIYTVKSLLHENNTRQFVTEHINTCLVRIDYSASRLSREEGESCSASCYHIVLRFGCRESQLNKSNLLNINMQVIKIYLNWNE